VTAYSQTSHVFQGERFGIAPRSIAAAVALTAQHMSAAIRSECLRNTNFQTAFVIAICPPAQTRRPKRACALCDGGHSWLCDVAEARLTISTTGRDWHIDPHQTRSDCAELHLGPQKDEPQPQSSWGSTPSELRVRGWGGLHPATDNDSAEGLFRPRQVFFGLACTASPLNWEELFPKPHWWQRPKAKLAIIQIA
jgi:hypothetical protein